jgi:glucosamine-6-phosphate deaminase
MGIGTILEARNLALLVRGKDRAETLRQALQGEIETTMPASYLRTAENLYVFADTAAASGLD